MSGKHQKEVRVRFQRLINGFALHPEVRWCCRSSNKMAYNDSAPIGIRLQHSVGPIQHGGVRPSVIFQKHDNKFHAAGAEEFKMVVVVRPIMSTIVISTAEMRFTKILVIKGGAAVWAAVWRLVVVAYCYAVRNTKWVF